MTSPHAGISLTVPSLDAKLLYLAMAYQLVQPGWEPGDFLDQRGGDLLAARQQLEPLLDQPSVRLELTLVQLAYLDSALQRMVNELKVYSLLDEMARTTRAEASHPGRRHQRSTARGFDATLLRLFPQVRADPGYADLLAGRVVALRRLSERVRRQADPAGAEPQAQAPPRPAKGRDRRGFWRR